MLPEFIRYLEAERRYSPLTVRNYRRDIERFLAWLDCTDATFDPRRVTPDDVRAWFIERMEQGRLGAASRKSEAESMRLVGASNWTIRLPFVLEGVVASFLGSMLACGALSALVKVFITDWLAQNVQWMPFITQRTVWLTAPVLVVGAMALSVVASTISLRRYLKA